MKKIAKLLGMVVASLLIIIGVGIIMTFPTMLLWNWALAPSINGINEIGLLQAWGINILFGILFKSNNSKQ